MTPPSGASTCHDDHIHRYSIIHTQREGCIYVFMYGTAHAVYVIFNYTAVRIDVS